MTAPGFSEIEMALTSTALAGDAGGLYRIASNLMDEGVPFDSVLFDYLLATERELGKRWEQADYLITEEHAATAAIETVIALLAGMLDQPGEGSSVAVVTAEGDDHSLPARAVAAELLFLGYRTTFLGANVPGVDFQEYLEIDRPDVIVLSAAMTGHLPGAHSVINAAHAVGVPVVVGGAAFGRDGIWADAVGADAWVGSLREVSGKVDEWTENGQVAPKAFTETPEGLSYLLAVRTKVLALAEHELSAKTGEVPTRLRDELGLLIDGIAAATLVDDPQVVIGVLTWQESSLAAHGYQGSLVVESMQSALDALAPAAGLILTEALKQGS